MKYNGSTKMFFMLLNFFTYNFSMKYNHLKSNSLQPHNIFMKYNRWGVLKWMKRNVFIYNIFMKYNLY